MDRDLAKLETMLKTELDKLDESRDFRVDQERQLEDEREQIKNSKTRIAAVKTPRELNAAQREMDSTRRLADKRQTELGSIDEAIAEAEGRIRTMESGLGELRDSVNVERERLTTISAKLERQAKKAMSSRKSLTDGIDKSLLSRYERIRKRAKGLGFVAVRERRCMGCKMAVAHQTYVSLRAAEAISPCENCGRLLYWAGLFPDDDKPSETKPKSAPAQ